MNDYVDEQQDNVDVRPVTLADLGLDHVAYIRPLPSQDGVGVSVHAANGQKIAVAPDSATAFGMIVQNEMEPVSLH